jgi:hypothetical protein
MFNAKILSNQNEVVNNFYKKSINISILPNTSSLIIFKAFLKGLIEDYGNNKGEVVLSDLPNKIKKLYLCVYCDWIGEQETFEECINEGDLSIECLFLEKKDNMQLCLDQMSDELEYENFINFTNDKGLNFRHHKDNNEVFLTR